MQTFLAVTQEVCNTYMAYHAITGEGFMAVFGAPVGQRISPPGSWQLLSWPSAPRVQPFGEARSRDGTAHRTVSLAV
jgi:hypothetical protein